MKKEIRQKDYEAFIAADGTVFENENQCRIYEQSALGVIRSRLNIVNITDAYRLYGGSDESKIEIAIVKNREDYENLQMYANIRSYDKKGFKNISDFTEGAFFIEFIGCEESIWRVISFDKFIENMKIVINEGKDQQNQGA